MLHFNSNYISVIHNNIQVLTMQRELPNSITEKQLIQNLKDSLSAYDRQEKHHKKAALLEKTYILNMEESYQKRSLEKQLNKIQTRIQSYQCVLEKQSIRRKQDNQSMSNVSEYEFKNIKSKEDLLKTMICKELSLKDIKITPDEQQKIFDQINNIKEINEDIAALVMQQGNNLNKVSEQVELAYQNAVETNKQLTIANQYATQARIKKIRAAIMASLAGIGGIFFGVFGMIGGLIGGLGFSKFLTKN